MLLLLLQTQLFKKICNIDLEYLVYQTTGDSADSCAMLTQMQNKFTYICNKASAEFSEVAEAGCSVYRIVVDQLV